MAVRKRDLDAEATRMALRQAGLRLFVEHGFASVSAEQLVRSAGLSRGALYHHFDGKPGLLRDLLGTLQADAAARVGEVMSFAVDAWGAALLGARAFFEVCAEPTYRQIVLVQGPIALGWAEWREIDRAHLGGLVLDGVRALQADGFAVGQSPELLAAALYGALTELAFAVAEAAEPAAELDRAVALFETLLRGLRPGS